MLMPRVFLTAKVGFKLIGHVVRTRGEVWLFNYMRESQCEIVKFLKR